MGLLFQSPVQNLHKLLWLLQPHIEKMLPYVWLLFYPYDLPAQSL